MRKFTHINASTIDEAVAALAKGNACAIAGGTDLVGMLKDNVLPDYPETVVNLKTIPDMDYITEDGGVIKIGALAILADIANSSVVKSKCGCLAEAAYRTASPNIREMGTIGGNICQNVRGWYFRKYNNRFNCLRKGGSMCYAEDGDNRYHSIFGAMNGCFSVNPGDTAPALIALDAKVVTTDRTVDAEDFFTMNGEKTTVLNDDEIVTEIQVPVFSGKCSFLKFAMRKSIDFPIVNCATAISNGTARICLNAVYNTPLRATAAEDAIAGQSITDSSAEAAGAAAVSDASALSMNSHKIQIAKTLVKRTILACK